MQEGKVKWFDSQKGYGFIQPEEGDDLFVHHSEVEGGTLEDGQTVEFEIGQGRKGPCAVKARVI